MKGKRLSKLVVLTLLVGSMASLTAQALPQGGNVVTSNVTITGTSGVMNIKGATASTQNVAINWQNYDIGKGETVNYSDMKNVLNYVSGGSTRSEIYGTINAANTNVYIVNPHGVLVGDGAQVTAQSFTASGRTMTADDIKGFSGSLPAATVSTSYGDVLNLGTIKANGVTFEGNNVTLRNTAGLTDQTGTILSSTNANGNVTIRATKAANVEVGYEVANTTSRAFTISGTSVSKDVHNYASPTKTNAGSTLGYSVNGAAQGVAQDFMLVDNVYDLQNMDKNLSGKYMLNPDAGSNGIIDATDTKNWNGGLGFYPVGEGNDPTQTPDTTLFTGTFDGLNFAIDGLTELRPALRNVGLFGYIGAAGTVQNLELSNLNLDGLDYVGGVAGANRGKIFNIKTSGTLTLEAGTTYNMIGGVVGYIPESASGTVDQCYNKATIIVSKNANKKNVFAGGICGELYGAKGTLSNSINSGNVYVYAGNTNDSHAGGIVSSSYGTVENSYNTGTIWVYDTTDGVSAAGIVGKAQGESSKIINTYNTGSILKGGTNTDGTITGATKGSGIVDKYKFNEPTLTNNFYDSSKTDYAYTATNTGTDFTTANSVGKQELSLLKKESTFTGWDFNDIWVIYEDSTTPLIKAFLKKAAFNSIDTYTATPTTRSTNYLGALLYAPSTTSIIYGGDIKAVNGDATALTYTDSGSYNVSKAFYSTQDGYFIDPYYVNKAPLQLTITGTDKTLVYGTAENTLTPYVWTYTGGLQGTDTLADALKNADGNTVSPAFTNMAYTDSTALAATLDSTGKSGSTGNTAAKGTITKDVGTYELLLTSDALKNYYIAPASATATVTAAPLTLTENNVTLEYGTKEANLVASTPYGYTYSALANGDAIGNVLTSAVTYKDNAYKNATAGTYTATTTYDAGTTGLTQEITNYTTGQTLGNYILTVNPGTVTINKNTTALKVTPVGTTSTYGDAKTILDNETYTATGVDGETVTLEGTAVYTTSALKDNNQHTNDVGSYNLTLDSSSLSNKNYVVKTSYTTADAITVTQASLTLKANDIFVVYGSAESKNTDKYGYTLTGLTNGDDATGSTVMSNLQTALGTVTYTDSAYTNTTGNGTYDGTKTKNVGENAQLSVTNVTVGKELSKNYKIDTIVNGVANITPATLTLTPKNISKIYGDAAGVKNAEDYDVTGYVNDDMTGTISGTGSYSTSALLSDSKTNDVGKYDISLDATGMTTTNKNYTLTGATKTQGVELTPASLTLKANDVVLEYGTKEADLIAVTPYGYTHSDLKNGDTIDNVLTDPVLYKDNAYKDAVAGTYTAIYTQDAGTTGLKQEITNYTNGQKLRNYTLVVDSGNVTINKATLTLTTRDADDMTYGQTDSFKPKGYDLTGFKYDQDTADNQVTGTATYSTGAIISDGKGGTKTADAYDTTGTTQNVYDVTYTGGLNSTNYNIVVADDKGSVKIKKADLVVTAGPVSMTYGQQEGNGVSSQYDYSSTPAVNGDKLDDILGTVTYKNSAYTEYTGGVGTKTGNVADGPYKLHITNDYSSVQNYNVTKNDGTVTMGKATLHVTPDGKTIPVGDPVGPLTGKVTGWTNGDDTKGYVPDYTAHVTDTNVPGAYDITGSFTYPDVNGNYDVDVTPGSLIIQGLAPADKKTYDDAKTSVSVHLGNGGRRSDDYTINIKNVEADSLNVGSTLQSTEERKETKEKSGEKRTVDNTTGVNALTINM